MTLAPQRLYLFRLGMTAVPLPGGHTLHMSLGCYLIQMNDGRHILVDSGYPPDHEHPAGTPPTQDAKTVLDYLDLLHLTPDDIDIVIATHFDVDHAGYADLFTKAEHIVQKRHYDIARGGHPRYEPGRNHWDNPALNYRTIEGDVELLPGVTLLETSGHCPGHQSVLVHLPNSGAVLLAIDAAMLGRLFNMNRAAGPGDDNADELLASTKKLLDLSEREPTLVIFGHDGIQWQTLKIAPEYYD